MWNLPHVKPSRNSQNISRISVIHRFISIIVTSLHVLHRTILRCHAIQWSWKSGNRNHISPVAWIQEYQEPRTSQYRECKIRHGFRSYKNVNLFNSNTNVCNIFKRLNYTRNNTWIVIFMIDKQQWSCSIEGRMCRGVMVGICLKEGWIVNTSCVVVRTLDQSGVTQCLRRTTITSLSTAASDSGRRLYVRVSVPLTL